MWFVACVAACACYRVWVSLYMRARVGASVCVHV